MKVTQCKGEGQGSCKRCSDKGKWNRTWMWSLYKVEGREGCYCADCVKEMEEEGDPMNTDDYLPGLVHDPCDTCDCQDFNSDRCKGCPYNPDNY